jgi:2-desacetyl-2-hydroxyethyl bacteriochlorophyllide A dehydrogenase
MKAAVFNGPGKSFSIETLPDPIPADGQVVIRIGRCGICGSDIHSTSPLEGEHPIAKSFASPPGSVLGHEFAGEIVGLGRSIRRLQVGDRIAALGATGCGRCSACLGGDLLWCSSRRLVAGGFAEYAVVDEHACIKLPSSLSMDDGALVEPLATGLHTVELAGPRPGADVLVLGVGPIGLAVIYWARRLGAGRIIAAARTERHKALALSVGATAFALTVGSESDLARSAYEAVFECTGSSGMIGWSIERVRPRGTVVVAGVCMCMDHLTPAWGILKEVRLQFALGYSMRDFHIVSREFESYGTVLRALVTKTVGFGGFPSAFEEQRGGAKQCKVLLDPDT